MTVSPTARLAAALMIENMVPAVGAHVIVRLLTKLDADGDGTWSETLIRDTSWCDHPLTGVPCLRLGPCRAVLRRGARAAGRRGGAAGVPGQQRRGGRRRGEHRRDFRGRCGPAQLKRRHAGGLDRVDHLFSGASTGVIFAGGAVQRNSGASDTASSR